ncbi:MAG: MarR family transcriptional regulator [Rikenellaceae bacterium]|nr:MarR family transcriptional regulator [Rikenellaceae bacterium]
MNERLKLENQLCFPLYVCAKEVIRRYAPLLEPYGLTYTQYIAMMVLWEHRSLTVKELGNYLFLDSGTLTPMLKKMERSGWLRRSRSNRDERVVVVSITEEGDWLQEQLVDVPTEIAQCLTLGGEEAMQLYRLLNTMIRTF